jgi:hypothetical protein
MLKKWFLRAALFTNSKKAELQLLQEQRLLLKEGISTSAEIMDADVSDERTGKLLHVKLWLKIKSADGVYQYIHSTTLMRFSQIPAKGTLVNIKYLPALASVVIL